MLQLKISNPFVHILGSALKGVPTILDNCKRQNVYISLNTNFNKMSSFALYLTDETKSKYMSDFQKLLNLTNSEFWDIDDELKEILIRINKNPNYQTLYSKKYKSNPDIWNLGGESYLEITSKKASWSQLSHTLNDFTSCSNLSKSLIELVECDPHENANFNSDSPIDIGCIKDPDYFKIKYFRISLESSDNNFHEIFWECIGRKIPM